MISQIEFKYIFIIRSLMYFTIIFKYWELTSNFLNYIMLKMENI